MKREMKYMLGGAAIVLVLAGTAVGASYLTSQSLQPAAKPVQQARVVHQYQPTSMASAQPVAQQKPCDDNNIVGTLGGGLAGGLIGSRFGSGNGKTVATVGGALGGAALGNHYIPTRGATCN